MPERWATIDGYITRRSNASERGAFLAEACAGDEALRH
jgi:hypothetical protein